MVLPNLVFGPSYTCAVELGVQTFPIFGLWAYTLMMNLWCSSQCALSSRSAVELDASAWCFHSVVPLILAFKPSYILVIVTRSNTVLCWPCTIFWFWACTSVLQSLSRLPTRVVTLFNRTCCFGVVLLCLGEHFVVRTLTNLWHFSQCASSPRSCELAASALCFHASVEHRVVRAFCNDLLVILPYYREWWKLSTLIVSSPAMCSWRKH